MFIAAQIDVAQVVTALAGLVTALGWAYTQYRTHSAVKRIDDSVGTTNGTDLATMGQQLLKLDTYTHASIHELRTMLTPVAALAPTDPNLLNRAVDNQIAQRAADAATVTGEGVAAEPTAAEIVAAKSRADHSQT